jgi:hypothetical protein
MPANGSLYMYGCQPPVPCLTLARVARRKPGHRLLFAPSCDGVRLAAARCRRSTMQGCCSRRGGSDFSKSALPPWRTHGATLRVASRRRGWTGRMVVVSGRPCAPKRKHTRVYRVAAARARAATVGLPAATSTLRRPLTLQVVAAGPPLGIPFQRPRWTFRVPALGNPRRILARQP